MHYLGFNYRMTDFQAALGASQLTRLEKFIQKRRRVASYYNKAFENNTFFDTPPEKGYAFHAYHLYPIRIRKTYLSNKSQIFKSLREKGIGVQTHHIPVYYHPYYYENGYKNVKCPSAEWYYESEISLPIFPNLTMKEMKYVVDTLLKVFRNITRG
jgi:dTDP-4-amino-4,6-dideoxygalactose transaminase